MPITVSEINILKIRRAGPPSTRVRGFNIDSPEPGPLSADVGLTFKGWVVATDARITGVILFCSGTLLRATPLDIPRPDAAAENNSQNPLCGFQFSLSPMELPPEFELIVFAVFANHELIQLATITGTHGPLPPPPTSNLQPLIVTSLGRSGTTYFMRLLSAHPQITAYRYYPYEGNAAAYWLHLFRTLTRRETPAAPPQHFDRGDWPAPAFIPPPASRTISLAGFLNTDYPTLVADFCRNSIETFYRQLAAANHQPDPKFFCEKFLPGGLGFMAANLYPEGREIFLVRDFRDVVCSIFAFNAKRGQTAFGREGVASDEAYLPELRKAAMALLENFHSRKGRAYLMRYEDLILRPKQTLAAAFDYLGLNHSPESIDALLRDSSAKDDQLKDHRTTESPEASIARWKRDLSPQLQSLCRKAFDDLLPKFGYQLDDDGNLILPDPEKN